MAALSRQSDRPLGAQLRDDCTRFDFYQLVRLLMREHVSAEQPRPMLERAVRFRGDLSLAFPASEITDVKDGPSGAPTTVTTPNYGVAGYLGPLPEAFSEWVQQRESDGQSAIADFLDLFTQRLNALRFRVKARVHPVLDNQDPERSSYAGPLAAIAGFAPLGLAVQLPLRRRALLGIAGLLGNRRRTLPVIEQVLQRYLAADVRVTPFRGAWQRIPQNAQLRLGKTNSRLGRDAVLGEKAWDQSAGIDVHIGPVAYARFRALLPGGAEHAALAALLRFLTDRQVDNHVHLRVDEATVPPSTLASRPGLQLSQSAWLTSTKEGDDARVATFVVPAYEQVDHAA